MFIQSQDRNVIFTLTDKGLLKGHVFAEDQYDIDGDFMGCNVYGRNLLRTYLLGTYEKDEREDEAAQVVDEIYRLLKAGCCFYSMPAPQMDLEDLVTDFDRSMEDD